MPPLRSFHKPADCESSSPTSRAALSRTSVISTLSRGIEADTVTTSRTRAGSSTTSSRTPLPSPTTMPAIAPGTRPGNSARST